MVMFCKYSGYTWSILLGMIITGAARSIVVKLAYQSGFQAPLTITLLYLLGQSFSLFAYVIQKWFINEYNNASSVRTDDLPKKSSQLNQYKGPSLDLEMGSSSAGVIDIDVRELHTNNSYSSPTKRQQDVSTISVHSGSTSPMSDASSSSALLGFEDVIPNGSIHGLTSESEERIKWVHRVPFYAKPAIPAILNLLNSALRWASLVYIDASVAEMLISGLELSLSVVAARIFRKRIVAKSRWIGVIVVSVGIIVIERANNSKHQQQQQQSSSSSGSEEMDNDNDGSSTGNDTSFGRAEDVMIGLFLIILQSVLSALQDLGEEIFMQAADFPATLMLGLEGLYGFCVGLIIYLTVGDKLRIEDIDSTVLMLRNNASLRWWVVGLPFLFLLTGLFNIKATEVTSAMTRNVWKNMRTVLVWAAALGIFYLGKDIAYGEAWHTPESYVILFGFGVMSAGIVIYYSAK